jgi:hypothetical protein
MALNIQQSFAAPRLKSCKSVVDDFKDFTYYLADNIKVDSAGGISTVQSNDVVNTVQSSATVYNEPQIIITTNDFLEQPTFESLDTNILTIDSVGRVTKVSDGAAEVLIKVGDYTKKEIISVASITPSTQIVSSEFITGSLGKDAADTIDPLLVGKTMASNGRIFTSQNHTTDTFIRNPDVWCSGVDLTCISPSNSNLNNRKAGTLVTPRHLAIAAHYEYGVGTKVYFVSQDGKNTVYETTVVAKVRHPNYGLLYPDITICCLDYDLPPAITPCKVLPPNYSDYLVETELGRPPALCLDQEEKALVTDVYRLANLAAFTAPKSANRLEFYESKIDGDSGNPAFLILDLGSGPELVLLTLWTNPGSGSGTFITPHITAINDMITTADTQAGNGGTGYTLTEADLSGFTNFA